MRYQHTIGCAVCGERRLCFWQPTAPFLGRWICQQCENPHQATDDLADVVKSQSALAPPRPSAVDPPVGSEQ